MEKLTLNKLPHCFVLTYDAGDDAVALDALIDWVNDPEVEFDWFDAAVLSHQMGQRLAKELKQHLQTGGL